MWMCKNVRAIYLVYDSGQTDVIQLLKDIQLYQKSLARFPAELARLETRNIVRTCEYNISARDF